MFECNYSSFHNYLVVAGWLADSVCYAMNHKKRKRTTNAVVDGARVASGNALRMANEAERIAGLVTDEFNKGRVTTDDLRAPLLRIQDEHSRIECLEDWYNAPLEERIQMLQSANDEGDDYFELEPERTYAFINGTPLHKREYKPPPPRCALCLEDVKLDTMFTKCAHMFCKSCCVRGHYLFDADNLKSCPVCRTEQPSSGIKIALYP